LLQPILTLPSGTELKGGSPGSAVKSLTLHTAVNAGQEFTIGSAFSDYIEAEIWADPGGSLQITAGDALTYYRQDDAGNRTKVGVFYAEKPTRTKRNSYKVTAYDTMSKLDADFSGWLRANQAQFPKTIWQLVQLACRRAGVTLASSSLPINGSYSVQAFYSDDLTCRQIISWAAEAAGCYAHMNADGKLQFLTYTDKRSTVKITPDGASNSTAYYADSLSYEDYTVKAIEKVQIRQSDSDVGVIYPDSTTATNTYAVQGNLLLTTGTEANLKSVVQNLYNVLKNVTYTPCKVSVPSSSGLACGQIVHVKDARGREFDTYLMSATISSGKASFESVGSASRESSSAVNSQSYKNLTGKMLEIKTSVDGLEVKASDLTGKYADLKATVDGLSSEMKKDTKITGGGNLILGSESFKNAKLGGNAIGGSSATYNDTGSATVTNAGSNRYFIFNTGGARITKGVTLCLSVMYKPISGTDGLCLSLTYAADNGNSYYTSITTENQLEIEQTDGWVLRYGTWTPDATGVLDTVELGCGSIRAGYGGSYTNKFSLLHPMLQYGNAPTAWNASSGDYLTQESAKSLFSQTADEIKTEVTKSVTETVTANVKDTATSAANDAVDSKLQDYATTATVNSLKEDVSSISQKADSISTKVSSLEETTTTISNDWDSTKREFKTVKESVSAIDQKADSITQTVTQRITGGNNIIAGTDDWNNATLDAGGNDLRKKGTYTISGESVRVTNRAQNTRFHFGADKSLVIAKGMTYCASVLYKLNSGTDSLFLQFETKNSSGAKSYYGNAFKNAKQDIELDNGWKLRWAAFTATADGYADGLFISTADDNATVANDLTIMHPMVQMGNAPTAWTASTGDYLTANETKTEIKQTVGEIKLTASTSGTSSTIKLTAGGTEITSAQINLSGVVTFSDLSTWNQDKTIINGGNITTGQLHNLNYTTVYDLDNAWIRMGAEAGERVFLDNRHIAWYATINTGSIGLTGVLYSEAGRSYFGASSKYMSYGWVDGLNPTSYVGMQITYNRSDDSDADFNTTRVGVSGKLNVHNLDVWGSKSRVVPTSFGALKMAAFETPLPTFADWGEGQCGPEGWCLIALDPRYAETIAQYGQPAWLLTDCDGTGHLWAENCGQYAIVHGAPRQQFVWLCMAAQRGYEGSYADRSDSSYPAGDPAGIELAASTAARAQEAGTDVATELLEIDTGADETADILLDESERLT
jgi:peptidoglycan hydrolase CwlO-like protein